MGSLSPIQSALVVGSLLGDGAMRCKLNALLEINHCMKQKAYVDWKFDVLRNLVGTAPRERAGNGTRRAYRFTTLSRRELTPFYRSFYREGRKVVPAVSLEPLTLAVWFMDDGAKSYKTVYLNTQQFAYDDQQRLLGMLEEQWNFKAYLNRDKQYLRIRLAVESAARFREIVRPYIRPEFEYKLAI
ncbi:MAG: hypothetical protein GIW94_09495 [Candidatus Eremiobacteraeota bacterium]|nr:hypothetical protein [Candidatus Eremiobacteraeota bacterium]MBC5821186.1 hypothetical protein [Candidatus Eremiobacteraeota bacterium]